MIQSSEKTGHVTGPPAYHQFLDQGHPKDYRAGQIKALARAIRARENRLILALPGMGVSNLLRFLVTRNDLFKRQVTFAYLDCDEFSDGPVFSFGAFFHKIAWQLEEQGLGDQLEEQMLSYERLNRLLAQAGGDALDRIAIVVDQTDELVSAADENLYRKLKALTDLNKRVCYIFSSSPSMADRVDPDNLLFAGRKLTVGRLNERDCAGAIVEEARRLGVEFDPATQVRLAWLTGGHPGLLRAVSSAADDEELSASDAKATWLERLSAREDVGYRCLRIWKELNPAQKLALRSTAEGQTDAVEPKTLAWLQDFGLVDKQRGAFRLFSPLFQRIIATQELESEPVTPALPESETQDLSLEPVWIKGPTSIDWDGKEIVVSGIVIKGDLEVDVSKLELRLIACLKRERRIFSKEDIASYVYYDESEKGLDIPEGRVEDLVRRVRKRLGKHYIKTHWGQGYELLG
jgi:hypothetical protein